MNLHPIRLAAFALAVLAPLAAGAGVCEPDSPATAVPQFDNDLAPGVSLWPLDAITGEIKLHPAGLPPGITRPELPPLPTNRDSTDFLTPTIPGEFSGHELFQDVAVAGSRDEGATQSDWLVVVYTSGLEVWDLRADPEMPALVAQKDGWPSPDGPDDWAEFPAPVESDRFVEAVDVVQDGAMLFIGVASRTSVGFAIWAFDTVSGNLDQVYQDPWNVDAVDVSMALNATGDITAYVADRGTVGNDGGVKIYDVSEAASLGLCVEPDGSYNCGVQLGEIGSLAKVQHVSALRVGDETYLAVSDGNEPGGALALELWQVGAPSTLRFSGLGTQVSSPQLFSYGGGQYLALIENVGGSPDPEQMRVHDVGQCLDADGCESLGDAKATETIKNSLPNAHFLDVSFSSGKPYLHYGMETTGLFGSGFERLWELEQLPATFALDTLPEVTDGGGTYPDPCSGAPVDYFGDYYSGNDYGLRQFNPRHAVFTGPFLYRVANSILDAHALVFPSIFSDGFETGDCSAWSGGCS